MRGATRITKGERGASWWPASPPCRRGQLGHALRGRHEELRAALAALATRALAAAAGDNGHAAWTLAPPMQPPWQPRHCASQPVHVPWHVPPQSMVTTMPGDGRDLDVRYTGGRAPCAGPLRLTLPDFIQDSGRLHLGPQESCWTLLPPEQPSWQPKHPASQPQHPPCRCHCNPGR